MISRSIYTALAASFLMSASASAELAVSANDGKVKLVDGAVQTVKDGKDSVSIIDLSANPPKVIATIPTAASVVGPPTSVALTPNESLALVTAAEKFDPADGSKRVPNDTLTVIDLSPLKGSIVGRLTKAISKSSAPAAEPKIVGTVKVGAGAAGISINKAGNLALVANRSEGTVSVLTINGTTVAEVGKVTLGDAKSGPSAVSFMPDGKSALVSMDGENSNKITVLSVDGTKVELAKRDINAGIRPYGLDISKKGDVAVVANIGRGQGDSDTVSVIDTKAAPPRVINTVSVGQTPEGIKLSPDGKFVAVTVMNGSNKPSTSPFFKPNGLVQVYQLGQNGSLTRIGDAQVGKWCQGAAWSSNSKTLLVQCMVEEEIHVFRVGGITSKGVTKSGVLKVTGGPAGIRTAE